MYLRISCFIMYICLCYYVFVHNIALLTEIICWTCSWLFIDTGIINFFRWKNIIVPLKEDRWKCPLSGTGWNTLLKEVRWYGGKCKWLSFTLLLMHGSFYSDPYNAHCVVLDEILLWKWNWMIWWQM